MNNNINEKIEKLFTELTLRLNKSTSSLNKELATLKKELDDNKVKKDDAERLSKFYNNIIEKKDSVYAKSNKIFGKEKNEDSLKEMRDLCTTELNEIYNNTKKLKEYIELSIKQNEENKGLICETKEEAKLSSKAKKIIGGTSLAALIIVIIATTKGCSNNKNEENSSTLDSSSIFTQDNSSKVDDSIESIIENDSSIIEDNIFDITNDQKVEERLDYIWSLLENEEIEGYKLRESDVDDLFCILNCTNKDNTIGRVEEPNDILNIVQTMDVIIKNIPDFDWNLFIDDSNIIGKEKISTLQTIWNNINSNKEIDVTKTMELLNNMYVDKDVENIENGGIKLLSDTFTTDICTQVFVKLDPQNKKAQNIVTLIIESSDCEDLHGNTVSYYAAHQIETSLALGFNEKQLRLK